MSFESLESFFIEYLDSNELPEHSPIGVVLFFITLALFVFLAWYHNRLQNNDQNGANVNFQDHQYTTTYNNTNTTTTTDESEEIRKPGYRINVKCTICFENAEWPVQTNCGHIYCGSCFITYYDYGSFLKSATCPLCRANVNILIPQWPDSFEYNNDSKNLKQEKLFIKEDYNDKFKNNIIKNIRWYNRRFSGAKITLWEQIRDLPVMLRNMIRHALNNHSVALFYRVRVVFLLVFVLLYVIMPRDLVPESIFGIAGFIDDIFIILLVVLQLAVHFRRVLNE